MELQNYLIFSLANAYYGIPTSVVQELFFLPELTSTTEAPPYVVGVINLRGTLVPVMSLSQRLGHDPHPPQISDSVIVLNLSGQCLGLLVNQIYEVRAVKPEHIQAELFALHRNDRTTVSCTANIAKLDDTVVTLLNPDNLVLSGDAELSDHHAARGQNWGSHFSIEEQKVLRDRATNLRQITQIEETSTLQAIAVFGLRGEYFGIPLEVVDEFADVHKITPIPCCPSHILGNMNLRGEILTLVDIGDTIHLPRKDSLSPKKAVIVRLKEVVAGIAVDEIYNVLHIHPGDIKSVSTTVHPVSSDYLQGVVAYQSGMMSLINLPRLFSAGEFIVDESI